MRTALHTFFFWAYSICALPISVPALALVFVLVSGLGLACAGCEPGGPDHAPEKIECLRGCAAQKDACILQAHVAAQVQQCDGQNRACVASCP